MPHNSNIFICDTSCLILFSKIDELHILKQLAVEVNITSIVQQEFGRPLPDWINIKDPLDPHYRRILEMEIDRGEASSIALALEMENSILIIDDLKGRKIAQRLSLRFSGSFGLILKAKQNGIIKSVMPVIQKVRNTNFRFSEDLFDTIIEEAGE